MSHTFARLSHDPKKKTEKKRRGKIMEEEGEKRGGR
jgi:hypothetical protein